MKKLIAIVALILGCSNPFGGEPDFDMEIRVWDKPGYYTDVYLFYDEGQLGSEQFIHYALWDEYTESILHSGTVDGPSPFLIGDYHDDFSTWVVIEVVDDGDVIWSHTFTESEYGEYSPYN